jgi:hypothetical protein
MRRRHAAGQRKVWGKQRPLGSFEGTEQRQAAKIVPLRPLQSCECAGLRKFGNFCRNLGLGGGGVEGEGVRASGVKATVSESGDHRELQYSTYSTFNFYHTRVQYSQYVLYLLLTEPTNLNQPRDVMDRHGSASSTT